MQGSGQSERSLRQALFQNKMTWGASEISGGAMKNSVAVMGPGGTDYAGAQAKKGGNRVSLAQRKKKR